VRRIDEAARAHAEELVRETAPRAIHGKII
jgi:hypothetical protein